MRREFYAFFKMQLHLFRNSKFISLSNLDATNLVYRVTIGVQWIILSSATAEEPIIPGSSHFAFHVCQWDSEKEGDGVLAASIATE